MKVMALILALAAMAQVGVPGGAPRVAPGGIKPAAKPAPRPVTRPTSKPAAIPEAKPIVLSTALDAKEGVTLGTKVNQRLGMPVVGVKAMRDAAGGKGGADKEDFEVTVPKGLAPAALAGVVVFVSAGDGAGGPGGMSAGYRDVLEKRGIIWVSPSDAGNGRGANWRVWCAARAVQVVSAEYAVDPGRVYVAGMSGGGKAACVAGLALPDVFAGTMAFCGPVYDRVVAVPGAEGQGFPGVRVVVDSRLAALRKTRPFALFTTDADMNLVPTRATADVMVADGYTRVMLKIAREGGHTMPVAADLEEMLGELDRAGKEEVPELLKKAAAAEKAGRAGDALLAYRQAWTRDTDRRDEVEPKMKKLREMYEKERGDAEKLPEERRAEGEKRIKLRWGDVKFNP